MSLGFFLYISRIFVKLLALRKRKISASFLDSRARSYHLQKFLWILNYRGSAKKPQKLNSLKTYVEVVVDKEHCLKLPLCRNVDVHRRVKLRLRNIQINFESLIHTCVGIGFLDALAELVIF